MFEKISFSEAFQAEDGIIFSSTDGDGIYCLEKDMREAELLVSFPYNLPENKMPYKSLIKAENKIFLPPCLAEDIMIYDCRTQKSQFIKIKKWIENQEDLCKFWTSILYNDHIYFIGHYYPAIVKINIFTMELSYLTDWVEQIEERKRLKDSPYLGIGIIHEGVAFLPCCCSNVVLGLDLNTDETKIYDIQTNIEGFNGICFSRDLYWLTSRNSYEVAIWDKNTNCTETINLKVEKQHSKELFFRPPLIFNEKLYLLPAAADCAYCIDTVDRRIHKINALDKILNTTQDIQPNLCKIASPPALIDKKIYFVTGKDNQWHIFDPISNNLVNFLVQADQRGKKEIRKKRRLKAFGENITQNNAIQIFVEEKEDSCKDFCEFLNENKKEIEYFKSQFAVNKGNVGQLIYKRLNM